MTGWRVYGWPSSRKQLIFCLTGFCFLNYFPYTAIQQVYKDSIPFVVPKQSASVAVGLKINIILYHVATFENVPVGVPIFRVKIL